MLPFLLTVLFTLLAGCPVYHLNTVPSSIILSGYREISVSGNFVHTPSGLRFPESIGGATRWKVLQYDAEGMNVSAGYNYQDSLCRLSATVYVYPTPRSSYIGANPDVVESTQASFLRKEFARVKAEDVLRVHPGAIIVSEGPRTAPAGATALHARFKYPMGAYSSPVPILGDLRLRILNYDWFLKYRLTYAEPCTAVAESQLGALMVVFEPGSL